LVVVAFGPTTSGKDGGRSSSHPVLKRMSLWLILFEAAIRRSFQQGRFVLS